MHESDPEIHSGIMILARIIAKKFYKQQRLCTDHNDGTQGQAAAIRDGDEDTATIKSHCVGVQ